MQVTMVEEKSEITHQQQQPMPLPELVTRAFLPVNAPAKMVGEVAG